MSKRKNLNINRSGFVSCLASLVRKASTDTFLRTDRTIICPTSAANTHTHTHTHTDTNKRRNAQVLSFRVGVVGQRVLVIAVQPDERLAQIPHNSVASCHLKFGSGRYCGLVSALTYRHARRSNYPTLSLITTDLVIVVNSAYAHD